MQNGAFGIASNNQTCSIPNCQISGTLKEKKTQTDTSAVRVAEVQTDGDFAVQITESGFARTFSAPLFHMFHLSQALGFTFFIFPLPYSIGFSHFIFDVREYDTKKRRGSRTWRPRRRASGTWRRLHQGCSSNKLCFSSIFVAETLRTRQM